MFAEIVEMYTEIAVSLHYLVNSTHAHTHVAGLFVNDMVDE